MTDHVLRRDEAAKLLDAVNENMWKATDHARYPTAALVALNSESQIGSPSPPPQKTPSTSPPKPPPPSTSRLRSNHDQLAYSTPHPHH